MNKKKPQKSNKFDYTSFEKTAISGLQSDQGLVGENDLLKELMSYLVQNSLEDYLAQSKERGESS